MKRISIVGIVLLLLTGCASKMNYSNEMTSDLYMPEVQEGFGSKDEMLSQDFVATERKQIVSASLAFKTQQFEDMIATLESIVGDVGGYIQNGNQELYQVDSRFGEYVLRIPTDKMETVIDELSVLGTLVSRSDHVDDITQSYTDIELHLQMLETEYTRLLELLEKAENIETVLLVEQRLSDVLYQIESYKTQLKNYDLQIKYSTLTISIREIAPTIQTSTSMWGEIQQQFILSIDTLIQGTQSLIVFVVGNVLYIILFALLGYGVYYLIKKRMSLKKDK